MASLSNLSAVKWGEVPGRPDQAVGIWLLEMQSSSDTLSVPALLSRSASNDQSSARVLSPATGVTVNAAALDETTRTHTLTIAGSSAGSQVILMTLHTRGRVNGA